LSGIFFLDFGFLSTNDADVVTVASAPEEIGTKKRVLDENETVIRKSITHY
jgi:hypothetical protein